MTARRRHRLLLLAPVVPAQRGNGLAMRTAFFLDAYAGHFDIDLAVFPIVAAPEGVNEFVRGRVARVEVFPRPAADAHFSLVAATKDASARLSAFRRYGLPSLASQAGAAPKCAMAQWMGDVHYDVVHVERLYLAPLAERWTSVRSDARPRLVLDCDDDDAATYRRLAALERRNDEPEKAAWADAEADAFALLAQRMLPYFDLAFAASHIDAISLSRWGAAVRVIPNVAPPGARLTAQHRSCRRQIVLFAGSMGYAPNADAARWLVTRIWPRLRRAVRTPLRLVLVGSDPSPFLLRLGRRSDVLVTGTVPDVAPFYRAADLAVVPIRAGGGTRIKLLEAAAHAVPIVSTTLGVEGTAFRHGRELLLADSDETFARACADLLHHRDRAVRLAGRARAMVCRDHDGRHWARHVGDLVCAALMNGTDEDRCRK